MEANRFLILSQLNLAAYYEPGYNFSSFNNGRRCVAVLLNRSSTCCGRGTGGGGGGGVQHTAVDTNLPYATRTVSPRGTASEGGRLRDNFG